LTFIVGTLAAPLDALSVETTRIFNAPTIKNVRLDWCKHWARDCGKPAAALFCRERGFERAKNWTIDRNVGARGIATVVFGDGRLCRGPNCSSFRAITCAKGSASRVIVLSAQVQPKSSTTRLQPTGKIAVAKIPQGVTVARPGTLNVAPRPRPRPKGLARQPQGEVTSQPGRR
jgi:hypothetical protein